MSLATEFERIKQGLRTRLVVPHQPVAVRWMIRREQASGVKGGILADAMGLGKTVEMLATMVANPVPGPTLIIVPKSLQRQWLEACRHFVGNEPCVVEARHASTVTSETLDSHRIVIVSYAVLIAARTGNNILRHRWGRVVADEAHALKNTRSVTRLAAMTLQSPIKWALTGTPVTRSRADLDRLLLWIGAQVTPDNRQRYVMRRTVEDVGAVCERARLPPCEITVTTVDLSEEEREYYNEILAEGRMVVAAADALGSGGNREAKRALVEIIMRLRQCCLSPQMVLDGRKVDDVWTGASSKIERIVQHMEEQPRGSKTLLFTHWNTEAAILASRLAGIGFHVERLHGGMTLDQRTEAIEAFSESAGKCVLISQIEVGGVGLNLQCADRIVIASPDWNSTSELQAIARAHRHGQTRKVFVARFIVSDSIEEYVLAVQSKKLGYASEALGDARIKGALQFTGTAWNEMRKIFD